MIERPDEQATAPSSDFDDVRTAMLAMLRQVADGDDAQQQAAIASLPGLPADIVDTLITKPAAAIGETLAANPETPSVHLRALAGHANLNVRVAVAANSNADAATLKSLAVAPRRAGRPAAQVAGNTNVPAELLRRLSADPDPIVRAEAFANPMLADHLRDVYEDTSMIVWGGAARNPLATPPVLDHLATFGHRAVQQAVARHPEVGPATLDGIVAEAFNNGDDDLVTEIAGHAHCHPALLRHLAYGHVHAAAVEATANPNCPAATISHRAARCDDHLAAAAANPSTPPATLTEAANSPDVGTRSAAARNPSLPGPLSERLAADADRSVRAAVAANPAAPRKVLFKLASRRDRPTGAALFSNPNCPTELLALAAKPASADRRHEAPIIARHPACPELALRLLATSPDPETARNVAANPNSALSAILAALSHPEALRDAWTALARREPPRPPPPPHKPPRTGPRRRRRAARNPPGTLKH